MLQYSSGKFSSVGYSACDTVLLKTRGAGLISLLSAFLYFLPSFISYLSPFLAFPYFLPSPISYLPLFLAFLAALAECLFRVSGTPPISLALLSARCFDITHIPYLHDCFVLIKNYGCVRVVVDQIENPSAVIIII